MRPSNAVRLLALSVIVSLVVIGHALGTRPAGSWVTSVSATGEVRIGQFEPLTASVTFGPDPFVVADGDDVWALLAIGSADIRRIDASSVRLCGGRGDCGVTGTPASVLDIEQDGGHATILFADVSAIVRSTNASVPPEGIVVPLAVSGTVGGRSFVATADLTLVEETPEPPVDDFAPSVGRESPAADPEPERSPQPVPETTPTESPSPPTDPDASPKESPAPDPPAEASPDPEPEPTPDESPTSDPTPDASPDATPSESAPPPAP
jgi:hypothetical protein